MNDNISTHFTSLSSRPESVTHLEFALEYIAEENHASNECYGNIMIAVIEAAVNAMVHGNKSDESKLVSIRVDIIKYEKLTFTITNEGEGFDHTQVLDPTAPENIERSCGRGIFLMKKLADECTFYDNGRIVVLEFNLV